MSVTLDTFQSARSQLNTSAPQNMLFIFFTLDTSHAERPVLNVFTAANVHDDNR